MELQSFADRDLHRDHLGCQLFFDLIEDALEVRVLLIHQRHEEQARQRAALAVVPDLLGTDFHAGARRQHDNGGIGGVHTREGVAGEVQVSRGVDQIDLRVHPLGHGQC